MTLRTTNVKFSNSIAQKVPVFSVNYIVVAGGGAGGTDTTGNGASGGGGAGGVLTGTLNVSTLDTFSINVGLGGLSVNDSLQRGNAGGNSTLITSTGTTITALGGGGGDGANGTLNGGPGGSGGGGGQPGAGATSTTNLGGTGTAGQGYAGGNGANGGASGDGQVRSGGGGGAGGPGLSARRANGSAGGGPGIQWLNGSYYGGGGGAGDDAGNGFTLGGIGGGGNGGNVGGVKAGSGTPNTGGGGGGNGADGGFGYGGDGGSGVVIVRYAGAPRASGGIISSAGGYTYHQFNSAGTFYANPQVPVISTVVSGPTYTSTEAPNIEDIAFSNDGTKMYLVYRTTSVIYQYTLSSPWNVNTATYASKSFSLSGQVSTNRQIGIVFSPDGTKLFAVSYPGSIIYQYTLSTPWDISTAVYSNVSFNVSTASSFTCGLWASDDGLSFYTCDPISDKVDRYLLSSAWDLSTATLTGRTSYVTTASAGAPQGVTFYGPYAMYVSDQNQNTYQYKLTTAWDVTTATLLTSKTSFGTGGDIAFSSDGTKAYHYASGGAVVTQWSVTLGVS